MDQDAHVQHTWQLAHPNGSQVGIDLWTDGETVRVDGGDDEATEGGRQMVERLLTKYQEAGYRSVRDYPVNAAETHSEPVEDDDPEPHDRPDGCPECGAAVEYEPNYGHPDVAGEGPAWLCTECKWGQWLTA